MFLIQWLSLLSFNFFKHSFNFMHYNPCECLCSSRLYPVSVSLYSVFFWNTLTLHWHTSTYSYAEHYLYSSIIAVSSDKLAWSVSFYIYEILSLLSLLKVAFSWPHNLNSVPKLWHLVWGFVLLFQMSWKAEIRQQMASMNSRASHIPRLEEDLVQRRHDELKHAQVSQLINIEYICGI